MRSARRSLAVLILLAILNAVIAAQKDPPKEAGTFRRPDLVEIAKLDPTIRLDVFRGSFRFALRSLDVSLQGSV